MNVQAFVFVPLCPVSGLAQRTQIRVYRVLAEAVGVETGPSVQILAPGTNLGILGK